MKILFFYKSLEGRVCVNSFVRLEGWKVGGGVDLEYPFLDAIHISVSTLLLSQGSIKRDLRVGRLFHA